MKSLCAGTWQAAKRESHGACCAISPCYWWPHVNAPSFTLPRLTRGLRVVCVCRLHTSLSKRIVLLPVRQDSTFEAVVGAGLARLERSVAHMCMSGRGLHAIDDMRGYRVDYGGAKAAPMVPFPHLFMCPGTRRAPRHDPPWRRVTGRSSLLHTVAPGGFAGSAKHAVHDLDEVVDDDDSGTIGSGSDSGDSTRAVVAVEKPRGAARRKQDLKRRLDGSPLSLVTKHQASKHVVRSPATAVPSLARLAVPTSPATHRQSAVATACAVDAAGTAVVDVTTGSPVLVGSGSGSGSGSGQRGRTQATGVDLTQSMEKPVFLSFAPLPSVFGVPVAGPHGVHSRTVQLSMLLDCEALCRVTHTHTHTPHPHPYPTFTPTPHTPHQIHSR